MASLELEVYKPGANFREQQNVSKGRTVFPGGIVANGRSCSVSSKPSLIDLGGHFLVKGTDLYTEIVNVIFGRNLQVLNVAHHLPKP